VMSVQQVLVIAILVLIVLFLAEFLAERVF
jgi:hypothetical protein